MKAPTPASVMFQNATHPRLRPPRPQALRRLHHPRRGPSASGGTRHLSAPTTRSYASIQDWGAKTKASCSHPEGAAATAAYDRLLASGELTPDHTVVLFNTGAGLKYTDMTAAAMHLRRPGTLPKSMPVGGIITPV